MSSAWASKVARRLWLSASPRWSASRGFCTAVSGSGGDTSEETAVSTSEQAEVPAPLEDIPDENYSALVGEIPESQHGRRMLIYSPARNAGTQGTSRMGYWKVEPMFPKQSWQNPLMGWTSTRDPLKSMHNVADSQFKNKESAIRWCISNGFEYEVREPAKKKPRPKNYASTFGRNGKPKLQPAPAAAAPTEADP